MSIAAAGRHQNFKDWKVKHGKDFKNDVDEVVAMAIFSENVNIVTQQNDLFAAGKSTFQIALNEFSGKRAIDMINTLCGTRVPHTSRALVQAVQPSADSFPPGPLTKSWLALIQPIVNQKVRNFQLQLVHDVK